MMELFLPDPLLDHWVKCTNDYAASILPVHGRRVITKGDILRFIGAIQYMGICRLPAKEDYFPGRRSDALPIHPLIKINKSNFDYMKKVDVIG